MALRIKTAEELQYAMVMLQIELFASITQQNQREEKECNTKKKISNITAALAID